MKGNHLWLVDSRHEEAWRHLTNDHPVLPRCSCCITIWRTGYSMFLCDLSSELQWLHQMIVYQPLISEVWRYVIPDFTNRSVGSVPIFSVTGICRKFSAVRVGIHHLCCVFNIPPLFFSFSLAPNYKNAIKTYLLIKPLEQEGRYQNGWLGVYRISKPLIRCV